MVYFFLRYGLICLLLIGWIFFQLIIKKRAWSEIQGDALFAIGMVTVWILIAFWMFD
jgi:hypothetical protein